MSEPHSFESHPDAAPLADHQVTVESASSALSYETPARFTEDRIERPQPWTSLFLAVPGAAFLVATLGGIRPAPGGLDCCGLCFGLGACFAVIPSLVVAGDRPSRVNIAGALVNVVAAVLTCRMIWQLMHESWI